jgi:mitochondrial fission protein ELM1
VTTRPLVWALHDGRVGIANQVIGLTEAVGLPFVEKRCLARFPWTILPPALWRDPARALAPESDPLEPPWPDLLITCGRVCAAAGIAVKRASGGRTFLVQIQDPRIGRRDFDLMVVPSHDPARGEKVLVTNGAVHRVTAARLADAKQRFAAAYADLPHPRIAVLIGGQNRVYRFGLEKLSAIADQIAALARRHGASLLVTPSRRTGKAGEDLLRARFAGLPAQIWDGSGDNPYFAYLALADAILVTEDSVSMVTEATATGKPVHVIPLAGGSRKFRAFHRQMRAAGITRPFTGALEEWRYQPPNDTALAAAEIRRRLGLDVPTPTIDPPTIDPRMIDARKIG